MAAQAPILQPGQLALHLSLAAVWVRAMLDRLDLARTATSVIDPSTYGAVGAAMATVLASHLAIAHARDAVGGAPWAGSVPMDRGTLEYLWSRSLRFRDAYMHLAEKADRVIEGAPAPTRTKPSGAISMAFGFEDGQAYLFAPVGKTSRRTLTRLSWDELEAAMQAIEAWLADLHQRWQEVSDRWPPYVEALGARGDPAGG